MANVYSELSNSIVLYQSTIANCRAQTGSYYQIQIDFADQAIEAINNPYDITVLEDCIKTTQVDSNANVVSWTWSPLIEGITFNLFPPASS